MSSKKEDSISGDRAASPKNSANRRSGSDAADLLPILNRISDGVVALDSRWHYTYVNESAAKMLQRDSSSDLIGRHIWTEFPEGVGQPFHRAYLQALWRRRT